MPGTEQLARAESLEETASSRDLYPKLLIAVSICQDALSWP